MNRRQLARNLATSLTRGAWTKAFLTAVLDRRLPTPLHKFSAKITSNLITEIPKTYAPNPNLVEATLLQDSQFERVYRFCHKRNTWPAEDLSPPIMAPTTPFIDLDLPQLPTVGAIAEWLFLPLEQLEYLADINNRHEEHSEASVNHYHYVLKPKKSGAMRVIEAPKQRLKAIQRLRFQ
jgi:RNA-directed DNA polymerase